MDSNKMVQNEVKHWKLRNMEKLETFHFSVPFDFPQSILFEQLFFNFQATILISHLKV